MRDQARQNYAAVVLPETKNEFGLGGYGVLTHDVTDGVLGMRRLAVLCQILEGEAADLVGCGVAADQSLRTAIGIPFKFEEAATLQVALHPVGRQRRARRRDRRVVRWPGWRYLLMRVVPADVPDLEKRFARVPDDAFRLLGSVSGDRLRVESAAGQKNGKYEIRDKAIRAYGLPESTADRRKKMAEPYIAARYPNPEEALGMKPDILPIYLDAGDRRRLRVDALDVVAVRRNLSHLLAREGREFGLAFFLSVLGIHAILSTPWVLAIAFFLAVFLTLANVRSRAGV